MAGNTAAPTQPLRYSECGSTVDVERLVIKDEVEDDELLFSSCPQNDFKAHVTQGQVVELATRLVAARIIQE
jgi:hypothetical protein